MPRTGIADHLRDGGGRAGRLAILQPGRNCWRVGRADRAAVLIDAAAYFEALDAALRQATRSIIIVGWDFDASTRLRAEPHSPNLGELLRSLVEERPALEVRVLVWNLSTLHAPGATTPLLFGAEWQRHPRIQVKLDSPHPIYGSHHQKIVCVDSSIAFVGGIDLTVNRWDSANHLPGDPRRVNADGSAYDPVHDIQMAVDGEVAAHVCAVANERWQSATGEVIGGGHRRELWPSSLQPDFCDSQIGVARTQPRRGMRRGHREIEALNIDALRSARRSIYIEAQYFADRRIGALLAAGLEREEGPEVMAVIAHKAHGFLEGKIMGGNRDRVLRMLQRADRFGRFQAYYPVVSEADDEDETEIFVHSKLLIVDDRYLRIGSSNFNRRSTGLDTECDLALEAHDEASRARIAEIRARFLAEHLGVRPELAAATLLEVGSLHETARRLAGGARQLRRYPQLPREGPTRLVPGTRFLDPRGPIRLASLFERWLRRAGAPPTVRTSFRLP